MFNEIIDNFEKHNIKAIAVENKTEAMQEIMRRIPKGSSVGHCGSATLEQIGVLDELRKGDYTFYDRATVKKYTPQSYELGHKAQHADFFLASSNAITKDGKIINKDRTGNRVSAMIYGPNNVILVVGKNKIVNNVDEGLERIKTIAAPMNAKRMEIKTPCALTGKCGDCNCADRICCATVIIERQFKKDRMTLIIVNEDLGY